MIDIGKIKVVAFDADDTLWENEALYREAERKWAGELAAYGDLPSLSERLYEVESRNMEDLGYGAKAFGLSLVECAVEIAGDGLAADAVGRILTYAREIIRNPAVPFEGVASTLRTVKASGRFRTVFLTKGDLLDQERKLERSGLRDYFDEVFILSNKSLRDYEKVLRMLSAEAGEFLMVGNSFKSDIQPVLELGGSGIFIPSKLLWAHEKTEVVEHPNYVEVASFGEIVRILLPDATVAI